MESAPRAVPARAAQTRDRGRGGPRAHLEGQPHVWLRLEPRGVQRRGDELGAAQLAVAVRVLGEERFDRGQTRGQTRSQTARSKGLVKEEEAGGAAKAGGCRSPPRP
jgi:hypothetical protein